jgi:hypothetical protein
MTSDTNIFLSTDVLGLKVKNTPVGKFGAFVSVPNRINMPVLVLDDLNKINVLTMEFMGLTQYMYKLGPGSISDEFFWYDGERLYPVQNDRSKGAIKLPDELIKRMKQ